MTVAASGNVTAVGQLADASALSYGGQLSKTNELAVYVPLYLAKRGFLSGSVVFDPTQAETDASTVSVKWCKPANAKDTRYPRGWPDGITVDLGASQFLVPVKPTTANPTQHYVLGTHNILGLVGAPTLTASTGKLTGSFKHPLSNRTVTYGGVVYQKTHAAGGYLSRPRPPVPSPATRNCSSL